MTRKALAIVVAAGVVAAWFWFRGGSSEEQVEAAGVPDELINRVWIDRVPLKDKQKIDIFLMVEDPQIGQFLKTSAYEGEYALFEWNDDGGKLTITMLQNDKQHRVRAEVSTKGCDPFDMCMKIKGAPRGAKTYYSMEDWVIEPHHGLGAGEVQSFVQSLQSPK
jgi:hypothetical protein